MAQRSLTKRKSPLAWVGGKSKLVPTLLPLIPTHTCYAEVFAGAAWLLFSKDPSKVEVINDINGDLITLYRVIQNHLEEFVRYFKWALVSRDEFARLKRVDESTLTDIQRAARFYYLLRNAFGAKATQQTFGIAKTGKPRFNLLRIEEELTEAHLRLSRVYIENLPYHELIKRYDSADTFLYVDPPYWNCEDDYGKNLFDKNDFTTLRDTLNNCSGKWLVSINDAPEIRALFKGHAIQEVATSYSIARQLNKPVKELLISNYLTV